MSSDLTWASSAEESLRMYDFLTGEAREASDINSTVEAQESWEVSSTVKAVPLDDAALEAASSNGRFLDVSRERRLTEGVGSDVFTSKDESEREKKLVQIRKNVKIWVRDGIPFFLH